MVWKTKFSGRRSSPNLKTMESKFACPAGCRKNTLQMVVQLTPRKGRAILKYKQRAIRWAAKPQIGVQHFNRTKLVMRACENDGTALTELIGLGHFQVQEYN